MKILVTGGAGFIGSNFVRQLLLPSDDRSPSNSVVVVDALTYSGNLANLKPVADLPNFAFIHGNILDRDLIHDAMSEVDAVVHFAAESHVDRSITNSKGFIETNVLGTQVVLDAALNRNVERFVHVSTDEVYGSIQSGSWDENCSLLPNSPYAASKAGSDLLVRSYYQTHKMNVSTTRCSNNYGPYQYPEKVIPLFVTNLMRGKKIPLYGQGLNSRDWLHVDDHCRGILQVLNFGRAGEIYNIGGGTELTNRELTEILLKHFNLGWEMVTQVEDRKGHDLRYSVSIKKIQNELGYQPQIKFSEGLNEVIDWYKSNEDWWMPLVNQQAN